MSKITRGFKTSIKDGCYLNAVMLLEMFPELKKSVSKDDLDVLFRFAMDSQDAYAMTVLFDSLDEMQMKSIIDWSHYNNKRGFNLSSMFNNFALILGYSMLFGYVEYIKDLQSIAKNNMHDYGIYLDFINKYLDSRIKPIDFEWDNSQVKEALKNDYSRIRMAIILNPFDILFVLDNSDKKDILEKALKKQDYLVMFHLSLVLNEELFALCNESQLYRGFLEKLADDMYDNHNKESIAQLHENSIHEVIVKGYKKYENLDVLLENIAKSEELSLMSAFASAHSSVDSIIQEDRILKTHNIILVAMYLNFKNSMVLSCFRNMISKYTYNDMEEIFSLVSSGQKKKLIEQAILENDEKLMRVLASTISSEEVLPLIDYLFQTAGDSIIIFWIICNQKGPVLEYMLGRILTVDGPEGYLSLVRKLYVIDAHNYLAAIDYVRNNSLFSKQDMKFLLDIYGDKDVVKKSRNFTYSQI